MPPKTDARTRAASRDVPGRRRRRGRSIRMCLSTAAVGTALAGTALAAPALAHSTHTKHHRAHRAHSHRTQVRARTDTATAAASGLLWNGDLSTGNLSQGWTNQACGPKQTVAPIGSSVVSSPAPPGLTHALKLTIADTSTAANCPGLGSPGNPNGQILSPPLFTPGMNVYIGFSVYIPTGFPQICTPYVLGCFFSFGEVYGPPYSGSPPFAMMGMGSHFFLGTRANSDAWNSPNWIPGQWNSFVLHVNFATDTTGYIELWYNGVQQKFYNGTTRMNEATLMSGVNWNGSTPDHLSLQQYRSGKVSMGTVTTYESGAKVGTTYASVAGM